MKDLAIKKKVLDEIMDLMVEKDKELLGKHPKFMAAKIEVEPKGSDDEMGLEKDLKKEMKAESVLGLDKDPLEVDAVENEEEELSPEMIEKLKELLGE